MLLQSIRELAFNRSPLNPHDLIILHKLCVKEDYNPNPTYVFTSVEVMGGKSEGGSVITVIESNCDSYNHDTVINLSDIRRPSGSE